MKQTVQYAEWKKPTVPPETQKTPCLLPCDFIAKYNTNVEFELMFYIFYFLKVVIFGKEICKCFNQGIRNEKEFGILFFFIDTL